MSQLMQERTEVRANRWRDDLQVAVAAAGVAAAGWLLATRVADVDLAVRSGSDTSHVGLVSALVTAAVVAMAGAGVLRLLERRTPRGLVIWSWLAGVVLVVSLAGPLGARTLAAGLCLAALHVSVGIVVILGLRARRSGHVA